MTRVLLTRPPGQNEALASALAEKGYQTDILPMQRIIPFNASDHPQQCQRIHQQMQALADYRHLIFVSTNAVAAAWPWLSDRWPLLADKPHCHAIGKATAKALAEHGIEADYGGPAMNSEALLARPALQQVAGDRVLICRGNSGRDYMRQQLQQRGAQVDYCDLYRREAIRYPAGTLAALLDKKPDFLLLTSTETIQALLDQAIIDNTRQSLEEVAVIVPGARVARYAAEKGFQQFVCAENAGLEAIMDALDQAKQ